MTKCGCITPMTDGQTDRVIDRQTDIKKNREQGKNKEHKRRKGKKGQENVNHKKYF